MFSLHSNACPAGLEELEKKLGSKTKHRKTTGRPRGDQKITRKQTIGVRVNTSEFADLQLKAATSGLPLSQWIRQTVLSRFVPRPRVPEVNREAYADLARLAGNINQLVRLTHHYQANLPLSQLHELQETINRVRLALIGVTDDCQNG